MTKRSTFVMSFSAMAVSMLLACSDQGAETDVAQSSAAPQTEEERAFILANKERIKVAAYLQNISSRYQLCSEIYSLDENSKREIEKRVQQWDAKLSADFTTSLEKKILGDLAEKTEVRMRSDHEKIKPTEEECAALSIKITEQKLIPAAKRFLE